MQEKTLSGIIQLFKIVILFIKTYTVCTINVEDYVNKRARDKERERYKRMSNKTL